MTDVNDGKWHGWNGGECPVHPKSVVHALWRKLPDSDIRGVERVAGEFQDACWHWATDGGKSDIEWFRVVKAYREPREFWITNNDGFAHDSLESAERDPLTEKHGFIHVREVIE